MSTMPPSNTRVPGTIRGLSPHFIARLTQPGPLQSYPLFAHSMAFMWAINGNQRLSNRLLLEAYRELFRLLRQRGVTSVDRVHTGIRSYPLATFFRLLQELFLQGHRDYEMLPALGPLDRGDVDYTLGRNLNILFTRFSQDSQGSEQESSFDSALESYLDVSYGEQPFERHIEELPVGTPLMPIGSLYFVTPIERLELGIHRPVITNPESTDQFSVRAALTSEQNTSEFLFRALQRLMDISRSNRYDSMDVFMEGFWHVAAQDPLTDYLNIHELERELLAVYHRDQILGAMPISSRYPLTSERPILAVRVIEVSEGPQRVITFEGLPGERHSLPADVFFYFFRVLTTFNSALLEVSESLNIALTLHSNQTLLP